jgi:flagellar motor switch protein FliG
MPAPSKKNGAGSATLTGAQKSAVLCLALGPEVASRILQKLAPEEVERVSREIAALSSVQGEVVNAVMAEFQQVAQDKGGGVHGGVAFAQQLLVETVGAQEAKGVLGRIREPEGTDLRTLEHAAPDVLGGLLLGEHPQTVALVLAHVGSAQAASLLRSMDADRAAEILTRMGRLESVTPQVLGLVQAGLPSSGDLPRIEKGAGPGGADLVADVMNQLADREQELLEAPSRT